MAARTDFLGPRAAELRRRFELPILVATLLVVPVIVVEEQATSSGTLMLASVVNWLIWTVFLVEYLALFLTAADRGAFVRWAWLDLVIVVVSFPLLPVIFAGSRLVRLLRLLRITTLVVRGTSALRTIFRKTGVAYAAILTALVALGAGGLFVLVEPERDSFADALWWAIVTITTVGYGDIAPQTALGRVAGVAVMLVGIGFVAILTAAIAAHFVEQEESQVGEQLGRIEERLQAIEAALQDRAEKGFRGD